MLYYTISQTFNPDAVCLILPYGPVSVGANHNLSKYDYSQCHGGATTRCSTPKSPVDHLLRDGMDMQS